MLGATGTSSISSPRGPAQCMGIHVCAHPQGCGCFFSSCRFSHWQSCTHIQALTGLVTQAATDRGLPSTPSQSTDHTAKCPPPLQPAGTGGHWGGHTHTFCIPQAPGQPLCPSLPTPWASSPAHRAPPGACHEHTQDTCSGGYTQATSSDKCQAQWL